MRLLQSSPQTLSRSAEWLYVACTTLFVIGLFLDGWAHNHVPELETFFTPWHAVFYAGYALIAIFLGVVRMRTRATGMPVGYKEAYIGAFIFLLGGIGDMTWHELFGVEKDIEALFSPTHLVLALGAVMMLSAPWLAVMRVGKAPKTFAARLPAILAMTYTASAIMFLTQFHHWSDLRLTGTLIPRNADMDQALAMAGYMWHVGILMVAMILLLRTFRPHCGMLTVLFVISTFGMAVMRMETVMDALPIVCIAYIAGYAADHWSVPVWPMEKRLTGFRWFSALVPAFLVALLHTYAILNSGTWWSIHMWTGAVAIAAGTGALIGLVMVPPSKD